MFNRIRITAGFIVVLFIVILIARCAGGKKEASVKEVIPVKVMKVNLTTINNSLDYVGNIKAQDEALIFPKVNGKIIEKLKNDSDAVNKSDIIAYIDRDEVGFQFEKAPVESPIAGIVGRIYVDIGTSVTPQTPVALVVNMNNVKIELDIPEKYLPKILLNQIAEIYVDAYPGEKFTGTVTKISPVVDLDTRTAPVEMVIPNSDYRLKPGMFAKVSLIIEEHKDVPVILKEAIIGRAPNQYVFIADNGIASLKNVTLGIHDGPYFEVTEGLKQGDMVVIMGQQRLRDGAFVRAEE
ncbi:MAG: efflux RND transporter periplasmic adaptor subunit [Candidatus Omnitrophota bacterium]